MDLGNATTQQETPRSLAGRLNLPFKNLSLLTCALTHRSFVNEHPESLEDNERLEFLGDAVLDFVVGAWLYNRFPEKPEGELTRMRSNLVCTEQLAGFARSINLGTAIRLGHGEAQSGGRQKDTLLCSTFEALIGAIYLQNDLEAVNNFVYPFLKIAGKSIFKEETLQDPKSRLQEWSQQQNLGIPQYVTIKISGPDHDHIFEVDVYVGGKKLGHGMGKNKQAATRSAAQNSIEMIEKSSHS